MNAAELHAIATQVCTAKELEALNLNIRGMSQRAIAAHLDISREAVRARLESAERKIERAIRQRKDAA